MALGEMKMFQFKSREQLKEEEEEYALWAFPHGEKQRENLCALIKELAPRKNAQSSLISFLTCKELYEKALKKPDSKHDIANHMLNVIKGYQQLVKPTEMPMYLALVMADAEVDESCEYPPADEMSARIQEFEKLRIDTSIRLFKRKKK